MYHDDWKYIPTIKVYATQCYIYYIYAVSYRRQLTTTCITYDSP